MAASVNVSREEYLKRYLNPEDTGKKTKKKKIKKIAPVKKPAGLKIIDTDIDIRVDNDDIEDEVGEEAPVIAGIIDERPIEAQFKTLKKYSQWEIDDENSVSSKNHDSAPSKAQSRLDSDGDLSPERHTAVSPPTIKPRRRHDSSDSNSSIEVTGASHEATSSHELSSPNKSLRSSSAPQPVVTKATFDSDGDLSPPRTKNSLPNAKLVVDSDGDFSPVRERDVSSSLVDSDGDLCSPRRSAYTGSVYSRNSSDISVHGRRHDSSGVKQSERNKDGSGPTQKRDSVSLRKDPSKTETLGSLPNNSPSSESSPHRTSIKGTKDKTGEKSRPDTTLSGLKAGLQSAALLREETDNLRKKQNKHFQKMNDELSGRNAEVIHRDRTTGKKRDLEAERKLTEEEELKKAEKEAKYAEWGRGIEQRANQVKQLEQDCYEMAKPLARYQDDEDLDRILKEQEREGDPMLQYMMKKKKKSQKGPVYPEYKGPSPAPNRFGIKPGYRWDGVDRSNGFERKYFEKINTAKSKESEAHLWSVQDM